MIKKFLLGIVLILVVVCTKGESSYFDIPKETVVDVGDATLFCRTMGKGDPLVIIHGGGGLSQDYLQPHMYRLAEKHFLIFYDQRGCGLSTGMIGSKTISIETFVNDLEAIRKAFSLDKVSILGHSWGGFLAMKYAIAYPYCVNKLILSNTSPASSEEVSFFYQEWDRRSAPIQKELMDLQNSQGFHDGDPNIVERCFHLIFQRYCYLPGKAALLNFRMAPAASLNGRKVWKILEESCFFSKFNLYSPLKRLRIPTLIVQGDSDVIPCSSAQKIHECINGSQYVLMERCGHFPYVEDPNMYFDTVFDFLK